MAGASPAVAAVAELPAVPEGEAALAAVVVVPTAETVMAAEEASAGAAAAGPAPVLAASVGAEAVIPAVI